MAYIPRGEFRLHSPIISQRMFVESWLAACGARQNSRGVKGPGHQCADFWTVLKSGRGGHRMRSLAGRYPEANWGALSMNWIGYYILAPGKTGPVATVRYEALRENIQECQARIFIERALLDKAGRLRLGEALAGRAQDVLDRRIRIALGRGQYRAAVASDLTELSEELYELAAEVNAALGGKTSAKE